MTDYCKEFKQVIRSVSSVNGKEFDPAKCEVVDRGVPHDVPQLPDGKMGIYAFLYKGRFLKIGKAGPKSKPRFSSHHYDPNSSRSNFAKSLLKKMSNCEIDENNVGDWIKTNCRRIDVIIDKELGPFALALIEAALHYYYEPKYEGFDSQRKAKN